MDQACDGGVVERDADAGRDIGSVRAPAAHTGHRAVRFVARQVRAIDPEELPQLSRDRREHLRRWDALRHQGRDASQGRLLVGQRCHFATSLGVRDRRRDELGELRQMRGGIIRESRTL